MTVAMDLVMRVERSQVINFMLPFMTTHDKLYIKNPINSLNLFTYLEPLKYPVWILIVIWYILVPASLTALIW